MKLETDHGATLLNRTSDLPNRITLSKSFGLFSILYLISTASIFWSVSASAEALAIEAFEYSQGSAFFEATGGAAVASTAGPSAIFSNSAGLSDMTGELVSYLDYSEPGYGVATKELRIALAADARFGVFGLGWYGRRVEESRENLFSIGFSRIVIRGAEGSYISVAACAVAGQVSCGCDDASSSRRMGTSADLGIIVRPLPVISFGYAANNILDREIGDSMEEWRRSCRWGVSYYWENIVTLSYSRSETSGKSTDHFGLSSATDLPIELMFGISQGRAAGGARLRGDRISGGIAFKVEEGGGVCWFVSLEFSILQGNMDGAR